MQRLLLAQRAAVVAEGEVSARVRIDRLERARRLLVTHQQPMCEAVAADFGQRSADITRLLDLFPAIALLEWDRIGISFWATADQILLVSQSLARML